jgi:glycosyltransferase involved in cell wall biosynthesis
VNLQSTESRSGAVPREVPAASHAAKATSGLASRILFLSSHVIQYSSPLFRRLAQDPRVDFQVAYCSLHGAEPSIDPEFGVEVTWDTPVLDGYRWMQLPNRALSPGLGRFFGLFNPGIWGVIRDGNFDAVVLPGYFYSTAWVALAAARFYGVPVFFLTDSHRLRSWRAQSPWKLRFKKWLVRRIFSVASAVMVSSSGGAEYVKSLGVPGNRVFLIPTAVDNDWWTDRARKVDRNAVRSDWNIPPDASVALFCAKLQPWKGPMDLLEAFARADAPNSYVVFAGDGPERGNLERRAVELGIAGRTRFLGFVNQSQLPAVYRTADLFVLPSLFEPFGLVVNEAMLCGLPAMVSDCVGAKYDLVRPGENGWVFPAGSVEALAAILRSVLGDRETLAGMGAAAERRMETWSPRQYADSMVQAVQLMQIAKPKTQRMPESKSV